MSEFCPISAMSIDKNAAQMNGLFCVIFSVVSVLTGFLALFPFLAFDFLIRGFISPRYSPFAILSRLLLRLLKIGPVMEDAGPKMFASKIGFVLSSFISLSYLTGLPGVFMILTAALVVCASLESFFDFCVGCKIYTLWNSAMRMSSVHATEGKEGTHRA